MGILFENDPKYHPPTHSLQTQSSQGLDSHKLAAMSLLEKGIQKGALI
jgi:hypothetical protein